MSNPREKHYDYNRFVIRDSDTGDYLSKIVKHEDLTGYQFTEDPKEALVFDSAEQAGGTALFMNVRSHLTAYVEGLD